ncbi:response regulator transcription factor [Natronosporangium hydrolyticum]|uniref:Response regulator transcription factor n=1 Tax=Natronosporangium hydrolyticum TaxID=2811111 RepID=A0A895YLF5_9ACTN|nr:response regulator transcription factor [Natronosporangium hydrolyticum]QSB16812.1 response regulator transcription factor [Natronosporangium hydrolyticum]
MQRDAAGSPAKVARVVICDQQTMVLAGLCAVLSPESDLAVVSEVRTAAEAITAVRTHRADLVLLGVPVPDLDLAAAVRRLAATGGTAPQLILMCTEREEELLLDAVRMGVRGVVSRSCSSTELLRDVRAVLAGKPALTPTMVGRLIDFAMRALPVGQQPAVAAALSRRELEVLGLIASGLNDSEIAEALWVSKATVRSHLHHVLTKLGVPSRAHAVAFYYQHGLAVAAPTR